MQTNRVIGISICRVAACLLVFVVHAGQYMNLGGIARRITDFGQFGVHLFFIISGYLAIMSLASGRVTSILNYYKKRCLRLLPLYYLIILIFLIVDEFLLKSVPPDELGLGWFRYIFLLNGFVGGGLLDKFGRHLDDSGFLLVLCPDSMGQQRSEIIKIRSDLSGDYMHCQAHDRSFGNRRGECFQESAVLCSGNMCILR